MNKIQSHIKNQLAEFGYYSFSTTYDKKNNRYKGIRTLKAAKSLDIDCIGHLELIRVRGLTKQYKITKRA